MLATLFIPRSPRLFIAVGSALISLTPLASAHQEDSFSTHAPHDPLSDPNAYRSPQYGVFEFRMGPYIPNIDDEFSNDTPYEDVFGTKPSVTFGVELDYQALRIPYLGTLGPGVGWHWFYNSGVAPFDEAGEPNPKPSAHKNSIWVMPMYAVAVFRADVLSRELNIPLVPYVKGGFAWSLWQSQDAGKISRVDGEKATGWSYGLQYQLGIMFHLNPIAPQTAIGMDNASGVNNAYIFAEWWASKVDSFGSGISTGAATWVAGVALEF